MSNVIYVVTAGTYSDYRIIGATTSRDHAKRIADAYNRDGGWSEAEIEEYIDSKEEEYPMWDIYFNYRGEARAISSMYRTGEEKINLIKTYKFPGAYDVDVSVRAKDKETAIKVAAERRAKAIAEKENL